MSTKVPARVAIRTELCKSCGLCVSVCPKSVLALHPRYVNRNGYRPSRAVRMSECIRCGSCEMICPDSCIMVIDEHAGQFSGKLVRREEEATDDA